MIASKVPFLRTRNYLKASEDTQLPRGSGRSSKYLCKSSRTTVISCLFRSNSRSRLIWPHSVNARISSPEQLLHARRFKFRFRNSDRIQGLLQKMRKNKVRRRKFLLPCSKYVSRIFQNGSLTLPSTNVLRATYARALSSGLKVHLLKNSQCVKNYFEHSTVLTCSGYSCAL